MLDQKSCAPLCFFVHVETGAEQLLASLQVSCVVENCTHRQEDLSVFFAALPSKLGVYVGVGRKAHFKTLRL